MATAAASKAAALLMQPKGSGSGPTRMGEKNTIWAQAMEAAKAAAKGQDGGQRPDANVFFVGARRGGKSTLLNRFLYPDQNQTPKSTEGMEYTYIRKSQVTQIEGQRKDVAHIWELSGSDDLVANVSAVESLFLSMRQVSTAVIVIVVDLSQPDEALDTVCAWLDRIKHRTDHVYERLRTRGSRLPDQLVARAKKAFVGKAEEGKPPEAHEDLSSIDFTGVSILVAATKWDVFADTEAELRRVMARALRYVCHCAGASLVYLSNLNATAGAEQRTAVLDRHLMSNFRSIVNHLTFNGPERLQAAVKVPLEFDHLHPLVIPAGCDKLAWIGRPRGGGNAAGSLSEWKEAFATLFPKAHEAPKTGFESAAYSAQYNEDDVDSVMQRKNAELEAYVQQHKENVERWKLAQRVARK